MTAARLVSQQKQCTVFIVAAAAVVAVVGVAVVGWLKEKKT